MDTYWSLMSWPLSLLLYLASVAVAVLWTAGTFLAGVCLAGRRTTARAVGRLARGVWALAVVVRRGGREAREPQEVVVCGRS